MIIARNSEELLAALSAARNQRGPEVAFVPTMGALHEGHLSLIDAAKGQAATAVASVYVNPTQFVAGEDFDSYPRDPEADSAALASRGCDILYLPQDADIYPAGFATSVLADPSLTDCLCGNSRGHQHFDGVATVVARLFGLVQPTSALFGQKDWQQLLVIKRMAADLHPWLHVIGVPTAREHDGLARSSRNTYLSRDERNIAVAVPDAVAAAQNHAQLDDQTRESVELAARSVLQRAGLAIDYCDVRNGSTLESPPADSPIDPSNLRIFIAANVGRTRLIDNASLADALNLSSSLQTDDSQRASTVSTAATAAA
jgi:pantoate--beta-alanine ligase